MQHFNYEHDFFMKAMTLVMITIYCNVSNRIMSLLVLSAVSIFKIKIWPFLFDLRCGGGGSIFVFLFLGDDSHYKDQNSDSN